MNQREFEVTYPEDYERKNLAGRTVKFRATVKAVRRKELPELNDEFAKDLGDFKTLEELKDTIRKNILREREHHAQEDGQAPVAGQAGGRARFSGAGSVYRPADSDQRRKPVAGSGRAGHGRQGPEAGLEQGSGIAEGQGHARREGVPACWIRSREREAIGATQEEVDREVQRIARQQREAVAVTRAKLQKDGAIGQDRGQHPHREDADDAVRAGPQGSGSAARGSGRSSGAGRPSIAVLTPGKGTRASMASTISAISRSAASGLSAAMNRQISSRSTRTSGWKS